MGGSQKAPPRILAPPAGRRTFAHVLTLDLACPHCGTVYGAPYGRPKSAAHHARHRSPVYGYNPVTGRFTCRTCERVYLVGVLFWRVSPRAKRPADTVPTSPEAVALRRQLEGTWQGRSRVLEVAPSERRGQVNRLIDPELGDVGESD